MNQTKMRVIRPAQPERGYKKIYGISIPDKIGVLFENTYFTVNKTEEGILLISGTHFKDIKGDVNLEQFKV